MIGDGVSVALGTIVFSRSEGLPSERQLEALLLLNRSRIGFKGNGASAVHSKAELWKEKKLSVPLRTLRL